MTPLTRPLSARQRIANWFYGFQPPERGSIVLGHRRVYIVPSRLGWIYAASLIVMLIGSINYALSLGFGLTFTLAGLGLAGMVHTFRNLARIAVAAGRVEPVFAGEKARFRIHIESRVRYERHSILVRQQASGAQLVTGVPAEGNSEVLLEVPAAKRGWLPLGRIMLETRYPLGLFRAWSYVEPDSRALVYPHPTVTPLPPVIASEVSGTVPTLAPGNDDFSGLRGYQSTDSPRHVAWKALARTDEMFTKQFTGESAAQLWLDWSLLPAALDLEARLSRLAGWVLSAEDSGAQYGLRLPGVEISQEHGDAHRSRCLEALATYEPRGERPACKGGGAGAGTGAGP